MPFPLLGMRWVVLCDLVCVDALKSERLSKVVVKSFMVVAVVPAVVLVVLMRMVLLVVSRLSKCSDMGGYLTMFKFPPHSDARIFLQR